MTTDPILTVLAADRHPGVRDICRWLDASHHTKPGRARDVARSFEAGAAGLLGMLPEDSAELTAGLQDADQLTTDPDVLYRRAREARDAKRADR